MTVRNTQGHTLFGRRHGCGVLTRKGKSGSRNIIA